MSDEAAGDAQTIGCICAGNWREIVSETEALFGQRFLSYDGHEFEYFGLVHGSDDYYFGMWSKEHGLRLLSCVGSIEGHGYSRVHGPFSTAGECIDSLQSDGHADAKDLT